MGSVKAFWYMSNNFGDSLNYDIIRYLSGKEPVYIDDRTKPHLICCGSILTEAKNTSTIWGAGFAWDHDRVYCSPNIITVRGNLTNEHIGYTAKMVGDPALLMPKIINPLVVKSYKRSIIPHWKDLELFMYLCKNTDIHIISPLKPVRDVIYDILASESILSTSLHGLILSDAYGVPNQWLDFGTDIGGDGFKFRDYYSTTDNRFAQPIKCINFAGCRVNKYLYDLDELIKTFPNE